MVTNCAVCGKITAVMWPEFYVYRKGDRYFCSDDCMNVFTTQETRKLAGFITRHFENKEGSMKQKVINLEQKKKAVEIAIQGGDPVEYLKKCGSKNPSAHWFYIRKVLKEKDPEKFSQMPDGKPKAEQPAPEAGVPEKEPDATVAEMYEALGVPKEAAEDQEEPVVIPAGDCEEIRGYSVHAEQHKTDFYFPELDEEACLGVTGTENMDSFKVTSIRGKFGEYHMDVKGQSMDFTGNDGEQICMIPSAWEEFIGEAAKALVFLKN